MAAAPGNQYASKARKWTQAIERALAKRSLAEQRETLDDLADVLIMEAMKGEQWAVKELGDRLEGKPAQGLIVGGDPENPLQVIGRIERPILDPRENPKA